MAIYRQTNENEKGRRMNMENIALTEAVYCILLALKKPRHGYGIMQLASELSGGRVKLAAGTLYGALGTLCEKGWIRELPVQTGSRRKEYVITEEGLVVVQAELDRLRQLVRIGEGILDGKSEGKE